MQLTLLLHIRSASCSGDLGAWSPPLHARRDGAPRAAYDLRVWCGICCAFRLLLCSRWCHGVILAERSRWRTRVRQTGGKTAERAGLRSLPLDDFCRAATVCRRWHTAATRKSAWPPNHGQQWLRSDDLQTLVDVPSPRTIRCNPDV